MFLSGVNDLEYGFEPVNERSLVRTIVADGFKYYSDAKKLFIPAIRASKILNIHYSAVRIYGGGPQIYTYGDLIQKITTLNLIIRYQLCKVVSDKYKRDEFKMNELSIEFIEGFLNDNGPVDDQSADIVFGFSDSYREEIIIDIAFQNHILGMLIIIIYKLTVK